jgi:hypothetical protein
MEGTMLAPLAALLLAQAVPLAPVPGAEPPPAAAPAQPAPQSVEERFLAARARLLEGALADGAAALEAIAADPAAGELAERARLLASLARDLSARGRFVPLAPAALPAGSSPGHDRGGRAELVLFSTLYGVYAAGATAMAADVQSGRVFSTLLLVGGGAGLGSSLWLTRTGPISSGRANLIDSAAVWAGYNGTLIGVIGEANPRVAAAISLASSAAGLTTAALLTRTDAPRVGTVAAANSGGIWGLATGAFLSIYYPTDVDLKLLLGTIVITADAGLALGAWLGEEHQVSRERALLIDAGSVVGILGGLAVYAITGLDDRTVSASCALAGLGVGLGSAIWFTRDWDEAPEATPTALEVGPWIAPTPDGRVAWGVAGRF